VGIGTSNPASILHIKHLGVGGDIISEIGSSYVSSANTCGFAIRELGTEKVALRYRRDGTGITDLKSSAHLAVSTGGTERMRIDSEGRVTMPYQPAFQVYFSGSHPHGAFTPTWNAGLYDIGNNVNLSTKRFVAPVDGLYHFDFWMVWSGVWDANRVIVYIGKNGSDTYSNQNYRSGQDTGLTMSCNIQLSANDYVDVDVYQDSGSTRSIMANNNWSGFSGYLIG
jgi:hypothetical protein